MRAEVLYNVSGLANCRELAEYFPSFFSLRDGIKIEAEEFSGEGYVLEKAEGGIKIRYSDLSHLQIALGDIIAGRNLAKFATPLQFRAVMLDCSRNAVFKLSFLKKFIARLSLMGMNYFCLYTEDTYEVEGEPLFGLFRGRYSKEELSNLVDFAERFGVTMFPCIQTLGHLEQVLKYSHYHRLRDNDRVLNALKDDTINFVSKLIDNAVEPYKSRIIHLGMDETWGIGRGEAFRDNTPINPRRIYAEYVAKIAKLCEVKGLKPIIWGDFVLGSSGEAPMNEEEVKIIPQSVTLNYWQYWCEDESTYHFDLEKVVNSGFDCIASPGLHNWNRFAPDFAKSLRSTGAMMKVLHQKKIKKVMMTIWGDDGHECMLDACWLPLAHYFESCRSAEVEELNYRKAAEKICGINFAKFAKLDLIGRVGDDLKSGGMVPSSKMFFYEDPLYPISCLMAQKGDKKELKKLARVFSRRDSVDEFSKLFDMYRLYCEICAGKISLAQNIKKHYPNNRKKLKKLASDAKKLSSKVKKFHSVFRGLWLKERKPFGLEEIDNRLAGLAYRLEILSDVLKDLIKGKIFGIEEMEVSVPLHLFRVWDLNTARKLRTRSQSIW